MKKLNSVLLVDDDEITNFINEHLLQEMEVAEQIIVTTNGLEGIKHIKSHHAAGQNCPELIFLDINMPVMDGFEFLEEYRQIEGPNHKSVVLVMLTSSENLKDMEQIKQSDNVDYLSKPLTKEKLHAVLEKHFGNNGS